MAVAAPVISAEEVVVNAERIRRRAQEIAEQYPQCTELAGQPSGWCVVSQKGWWPYAFHNMVDEDILRERINDGHRVIITVGLVAKPGCKFSPTDHVAVVAGANSEPPLDRKLTRLIRRAKHRAASALLR